MQMWQKETHACDNIHVAET